MLEAVRLKGEGFRHGTLKINTFSPFIFWTRLLIKLSSRIEGREEQYFTFLFFPPLYSILDRPFLRINHHRLPIRRDRSFDFIYPA